MSKEHAVHAMQDAVAAAMQRVTPAQGGCDEGGGAMQAAPNALLHTCTAKYHTCTNGMPAVLLCNWARDLLVVLMSLAMAMSHMQ